MPDLYAPIPLYQKVGSTLRHCLQIVAKLS